MRLAALVTTRLKIELQRLDARLRQTPYPPLSHGFAGSFVEALYRPESRPSAPTGHSLDTPREVGLPGRSAMGAGESPRTAQVSRVQEPGRLSNPCASVQDAAQEAAQVQGANRPTREFYQHGPAWRAEELRRQLDHALNQKERP